MFGGIGKKPAFKMSVLIKDIIITVMIVIVLFFCFWPASIDGTSMNPTLNNGDRIILSRMMLWFKKPAFGDLVICKMNEKGRNIDIIKRVIAVPGDKLKITDGKVFLNDKELYEEYLDYDYTQGYVDLTLGTNQYFLMGDNRVASSDSRGLGPFDGNDIVGLVMFRWFPFNEMKLLMQ